MQIKKNNFMSLFKNLHCPFRSSVHLLAVVLIISITQKFINCMNVISYYHRFNITSKLSGNIYK